MTGAMPPGAALGAVSSGVLDRLALRELSETYARCADRRDGEGLAALFEPDGVLRVVPRGAEAPSGELSGRVDIAAAIERLDRYAATLHVVANHYASVEGDAATAEVYCLAHHLVDGADGQTDHVMLIRYFDRYRRTADGWRFVARELQVDWTEQRVVTSSPSSQRPTSIEEWLP